MTGTAETDPRALRAEQLLAASRLFDPATAPRAELARVIADLQTATGLALDAHAALATGTPAGAPTAAHPGTPAPRDVPAEVHPGAPADDLLDHARRIDLEHRAATRKPASLRVLKTRLGIGQARAQQLQRALATRTEGSTP